MTRIRRALSTGSPIQIVVAIIALTSFTPRRAAAQEASRTLVAVSGRVDAELTFDASVAAQLQCVSP